MYCYLYSLDEIYLIAFSIMLNLKYAVLLPGTHWRKKPPYTPRIWNMLGMFDFSYVAYQ